MSDRRERLETERSVAEAEPKGTSYEVKDMSRMSRDGSGRRMNGSLLIISLPLPSEGEEVGGAAHVSSRSVGFLILSGHVVNLPHE